MIVAQEESAQEALGPSTAFGSVAVNYSNNSTDVVAIGATGGSATSTAKFWFDPNSQVGYSDKVGIGTTLHTADFLFGEGYCNNQNV